MYLQNEIEHIAKRLFDENICKQPLSERDLTEIYRYLGMLDTGSDLMRRLSDIEINFEEIKSEADEAVIKVIDSVTICKDLFKLMIDDWSARGLTSSFSFSVSESDLSEMYQSFSTTTEYLRGAINELTIASELLTETAMQSKACSASFLEVYAETRLAYYASALNKDTENMLACRAIAFQAHDSSSESNKFSARYLSVSNSVTSAISVINSTISDATVFFTNISTKSPANTIIRGIEVLNNIVSSIK